MRDECQNVGNFLRSFYIWELAKKRFKAIFPEPICKATTKAYCKQDERVAMDEYSEYIHNTPTMLEVVMKHGSYIHEKLPNPQESPQL